MTYSSLTLYNNNNNNYKTIAPLFLNRIELSGAPSTVVGHSHSPGTMQSASTMIRWQGTLEGISESENVSFSNGDGTKLCYLMT